MTQYQLNILSVACIDQQETLGDEPYLKVNGGTIWESTGDMTQGETQDVDRIIRFSDSAEVSLWEEDGFPGDADDLFGTRTVDGSQEPGGQFKLPYHTDNAEYEVWVDVGIDPFPSVA